MHFLREQFGARFRNKPLSEQFFKGAIISCFEMHFLRKQFLIITNI